MATSVSIDRVLSCTDTNGLRFPAFPSWEEVWSPFHGGRAPEDGCCQHHTVSMSEMRRAMSWSACWVSSSRFPVRSLGSLNKLSTKRVCGSMQKYWGVLSPPQAIVQSQEHPFHCHHLITYRGESNLIYFLHLKQRH